MFGQHNFDPDKRSHQKGQPQILSSSEHNWDPRFHKDPKGVIHQLKILDRVIDKNEEELKSSGTPMTLWKYFPFGPPCECEKDSNCVLCFGSGFINGYQKYGYHTYTYADSSIDLEGKYGLNLTDNVESFDLPNTTTNSFMLTSGTSGYLETNWVPISAETWRALEHTYIKARIFTPVNTSIMYSFTVNGIDYTNVFDLQQALPVPEDATQIKIRVTLNRNTISDPSPGVNCFKYRFRIKPFYSEYDSRFVEADIPSFLASKQVTVRNYVTNEEGNVQTHLPKFWALPDVKIDTKDIGMFIQGNHRLKRFEFEKIELSEHGEDSRVLHTSWSSRFIFSTDDVLGSLYSLD
jgi:hypothetical protein